VSAARIMISEVPRLRVLVARWGENQSQRALLVLRGLRGEDEAVQLDWEFDRA
jgi:hypothetical protein